MPVAFNFGCLLRPDVSTPAAFASLLFDPPGPGILVVDSNGVEVRSCQHSGVEVGLDCGVTKLG